MYLSSANLSCKWVLWACWQSTGVCCWASTFMTTPAAAASDLMLRLSGLSGEGILLNISLVGVVLPPLILTSLSSSCVETLGDGLEAGVGVLEYENGTDLDLGMVFDLREVKEATMECPWRFLGGCGNVLVWDKEYRDVGRGLWGHWVEDELSEWPAWCSGIKGSMGSRGSRGLLVLP